LAKKPSAVYEPGELDRVRSRLGNLDRDEAKRVASLLGGEVGIERGAMPPPAREHKPGTREETVSVSVRGKSKGGAPLRRVETVGTDDDRSYRRDKSDAKRRGSSAIDSSDDPASPTKASYRERLRIDRLMAQSEFEIKNSAQALYSMLSLFGEPSENVNPIFVTARMNDYYSRLEVLVTATRTMLPRNNVQRSEALKKESPFAFKLLDLIRQWNIERIAADLARLQSKPREVVVSDFTDILKALYRPIYQLGSLDPETHVRDAYHVLFKQLSAENALEAKEKYNAQFRAALAAYVYVTRSVRYLLYPLLLKLLSDKWLSYDEFFIARRHRFEAFIGAKESDKLSPLAPSAPKGDVSETESSPKAENDKSAEESVATVDTVATAESENEPVEEKEQTSAPSRAWSRGIDALEGIFPEAGWRRLSSFPDLYPYFSGVFDLKKGFELVAPDDPLQQAVILMHILEELFYGLRFVEFGTISGANGEPERADATISAIISNWHGYLEEALGKEYLPRLSEYARMADGSPESRMSNYAKRTLSELLWIKRLSFLPFLRFESTFTTHPYRNQEEKPFYTEVRELRRLLTSIAVGIEAGMKQGGAAKGARCDGIDNPWVPYVFQIPNPVSTRLDSILGGRNSKRKNNAALVFFTLSAVTILDSIVNDKESYAYQGPAVCPFRSIDGQGTKPVFGVDEHIDADALFKQARKNRSGNAAAQEG